MNKIDVRECPANKHLDAAIARELGLNVVATNWPCMSFGDYVVAADLIDTDGDSAVGGEWPERCAVYIPDDWVDPVWPPSEEVAQELFVEDALYADVKAVPHYSTRIEKAWELIPKVDAICSGFPMNISMVVDFKPDGPRITWFCEMHLDEWAHGRAPTIALAICRAFLLVRGVEEVECGDATDDVDGE